jgi:hypothetical protein
VWLVGAEMDVSVGSDHESAGARRNPIKLQSCTIGKEKSREGVTRKKKREKMGRERATAIRASSDDSAVLQERKSDEENSGREDSHVLL